MGNDPDDATISDDGNYRWDGDQWQPIGHQEGDAGGAGGPAQIQLDPAEFPNIFALSSMTYEGYLALNEIPGSAIMEEGTASA